MPDERTWTTCPVCHGVGASTETVTHSPGGVDTRTVTPCRACNGTGMVDAGKLVDERVAELEAAVTTLEDRCDEYAAALNDSAELCDRLRAYYRRERRAVEMLAKHAAWHDAVPAGCPPGREYGGPATEKRACTVAPTCAACWVAWAQKQAREEGGVKPDTERSE